MKIIFAQGNPGTEYVATRHNVGWQFLDAYAKKRGLEFVSKAKFRADITEFTEAGEKCLLVKPTTFYNDTGLSARSLADFYKLTPEDFLIVHDELALPLGTLRTRQGGSDAGNNGIKSLNTHLGEATARLRIGIFDAETEQDAVSFVLGKLTASEKKTLTEIEPLVFEAFEHFLSGEFDTTTHKKN